MGGVVCGDDPRVILEDDGGSPGGRCRSGRLLAEVTGALLDAGAVDHALSRLVREAAVTV